MNGEKYDQIGIGYNNTRQADPYLAARLLHLLHPESGQRFLDIGCGTGNYTSVFRQAGHRFIGMDPSTQMLSVAHKNHPHEDWIPGTAEQTNLKSDSVDGITASLTIHHWQNLEMAFNELNRVLKSHGKLILFTSTPEQMKGYWLNDYFPKMLQDSMDQMPGLPRISAELQNSGFQIAAVEKYFVSDELKDLFLYSGKHRPHLYLDGNVRQGISSFSDLSNIKEVDAGLAQLALDIDSGNIQAKINQYENDRGDYLFLVAQKI